MDRVRKHESLAYRLSGAYHRTRARTARICSSSSAGTCDGGPARGSGSPGGSVNRKGQIRTDSLNDIMGSPCASHSADGIVQPNVVQNPGMVREGADDHRESCCRSRCQEMLCCSPIIKYIRARGEIVSILEAIPPPACAGGPLPDRDEASRRVNATHPVPHPSSGEKPLLFRICREKATFSKNCGRCRKAHGERACRIQTIKRKG